MMKVRRRLSCSSRKRRPVERTDNECHGLRVYNLELWTTEAMARTAWHGFHLSAGRLEMMIMPRCSFMRLSCSLDDSNVYKFMLTTDCEYQFLLLLLDRLDYHDETHHTQTCSERRCGIIDYQLLSDNPSSPFFTSCLLIVGSFADIKMGHRAFIEHEQCCRTMRNIVSMRKPLPETKVYG